MIQLSADAAESWTGSPDGARCANPSEQTRRSDRAKHHHPVVRGADTRAEARDHASHHGGHGHHRQDQGRPGSHRLPGRREVGLGVEREARERRVSTPAEAAPSAPGRWTVLESDWAFRSRFVGIRRDRCRLPDGRQSPEFYFMELRDVCLVVALTPGGEVLLSREYKHGAGDVIATLPAGFVEPAEEPAAAARRELAEETGHAAAVLEPLGSQWLFPS